MKNWKKCLGFTAIAAVIVFLATCSTDDGPASFGNKLELTGQVYLVKYTYNDSYAHGNYVPSSVSYQNFTGNLAVTSYGGGSGTIANGKLNFSIETPSSLSTLDFDRFFDSDDYTNLQISKTGVKGNYFSYLEVTPSTNYEGLSKGNTEYSVGANSISMNGESVMYVYVEEAVTVTAKGKTVTDTYTEGGVTYTYTTTTGNLNLAFKAGWNAVYRKGSSSSSWTGTFENPTNPKATQNLSYSLSNPSSVRWVLEERDNDYSILIAPENSVLKNFNNLRQNRR